MVGAWACHLGSRYLSLSVVGVLSDGYSAKMRKGSMRGWRDGLGALVVLVDDLGLILEHPHDSSQLIVLFQGI